MNKRNLFAIILFVVIVGASWFAYEQRYAINDWFKLRNYTPPAEVAQLASLASLNEYGERLFYVNDPQIQGRGEFNGSCDLDHEGLILGCYDGTGIYIFDVTEARLEKVEQVTAAHEMLHAAYDRLSAGERREVNDMLAREYGRITDERLLDIIELYRRQDESVLNNELHSIIGTEVADISPELEAYYSQYFVDRSVVVGAAEEYESVFIEIENRIESLEAQLDSIAESISSEEQRLGGLRGQIETERARLNQLLEAEQIEQYNAAVPGYNQLVNSYNGAITAYEALINRYNSVLEIYNETAFQQNQYVNNLNSNFEPI